VGHDKIKDHSKCGCSVLNARISVLEVDLARSEHAYEAIQQAQAKNAEVYKQAEADLASERARVCDECGENRPEWCALCRMSAREVVEREAELRHKAEAELAEARKCLSAEIGTSSAQAERAEKAESEAARLRERLNDTWSSLRLAAKECDALRAALKTRSECASYDTPMGTRCETHRRPLYACRDEALEALSPPPAPKPLCQCPDTASFNHYPDWHDGNNWNGEKHPIRAPSGTAKAANPRDSGRRDEGFDSPVAEKPVEQVYCLAAACCDRCATGRCCGDLDKAPPAPAKCVDGGWGRCAVHGGLLNTGGLCPDAKGA